LEGEAQLQQKGVRLDGHMDLSARVGHLNSLYEQGAINDEEYNNRAAALHVAKEILDCCISGNIPQLELLFRENPNLDLNNISENEATLLHIVASSVRQGKSKPQVLKHLLENRLQVDKKKSGQTALLSICAQSNFPNAAECARILTSFGADARASATIQGKGTAFTCIQGAVESGGSAELLEVLCKAGANPNDTLEPHGPVLNYCIIEGLVDQAISLLRNGANPNTTEINNGATALASAITSGLTEVVKALLDRNVNVNAPIMKDQKVTGKEFAKYMADKGQGNNAQAIARLLGH